MADNMEYWDKLSRTDPKHTKGFTRAGGFKGTAIKPIYTEQKMTEVFGPAGKGWGMGEPLFQTVPGNDGQVAVFCTVGLWWADPGDEAKNYVHTVYGVGGDMVVVKQSSGLRTDDEAFKKAFTDAVGNAMKHLGMSADVHMGLFDDSKYVQEREREERAQEAPSETVQPSQEPLATQTANMHLKTIRDALFACTTLTQMAGEWGRNEPVVATMSPSYQEDLSKWYHELLGYRADEMVKDIEQTLNLTALQERFTKYSKDAREMPGYLKAIVAAKDKRKAELEAPSSPPTAAESLDRLELTQAQKIAGTP